MKMVDRVKTILMVMEKFSKDHAITCPKPDTQLLHNSEGMCGIGCLGCGKVIQLPSLTGDPITNLHKWEEALIEARSQVK